jgi:cytochrome c553
MNQITSKQAVLAIIMACVASPLPAQESLPIRNCTWCHGSSAQGYTSAPRIAGQTHRYIENSLLSFKSHARDNPASKQYMWGAAANLSGETARGFAVYFSELPASPANDGDVDLRGGETCLERRVLHCMSWPERGRLRRHSAFRRHGPRLSETTP